MRTELQLATYLDRCWCEGIFRRMPVYRDSFNFNRQCYNLRNVFLRLNRHPFRAFFQRWSLKPAFLYEAEATRCGDIGDFTNRDLRLSYSIGFSGCGVLLDFFNWFIVCLGTRRVEDELHDFRYP